MKEDILVQGARTHNLKNISVRIPRDSLTVITGLSGSGKSSLAFDTLYAEGQRRYVESLSAYARQFLDRLQKPEVERIEGLSPAIAIEQRGLMANPRSIVATSTEIHDYLRLLFAALGSPHCPQCGLPVRRQSAEKIVEEVLALPEGAKLMLLAPVARNLAGKELSGTLAELRRQGFVRARLDGGIVELDRRADQPGGRAGRVDVVIDRLVIRQGIRSRLTDSVELALKQGRGALYVLDVSDQDNPGEQSFSEQLSCDRCDLRFAPLSSRSFSFNSPYGACPACAGLGVEMVFDESTVVPDRNLSLEEGAIRPWRRGGRRLIIYYKQLLRWIARHGEVDLETPYRELPARFRKLLLYGSGDRSITRYYRRGGVVRKRQAPFEGVIPNLKRRLAETTSDTVRQTLRGYMLRRRCSACGGARLRPEALSCLVQDQSIAGVCAMTPRQALAWFDNLSFEQGQNDIALPLSGEIKRRLRFLMDVGLDYLTLDRESSTLSGGEAQRIRLASQIGSGLAGVLYVLDEPTIGLHARDGQRLIAMLGALRQAGNTVVVVEHDAAMIKAADHLIDLGPGAGREGGRLIFQGKPRDLLKQPDSLTAQYLTGARSTPRPERRRPPENGCLLLHGASAHNLKNINVAIPLGLLICITGVSGSGKSSLVEDVIQLNLARSLSRPRGRLENLKRLTGAGAVDKVIVIDQAPIGRTPRSNPATYTGAFDGIRKIFAMTPAARMRGYTAGRFSFNLKGGRCEVCRGDGLVRVEMHFLPDIYVPCEQCGGRRYNRETLEIKYNGHDISEVLALTIDEALTLFEPVPAVANRLRVLAEVGLGYLQLGQPATTLSGGEAQRVKLADELARRATGRTIYLLDEPTTGLHFADIHRLIEMLLRLRSSGNTVIVIEHNLDVIKAADHIIDLGPEGGEAGGRVVACGPPEKVARCRQSYTGKYLAPVLKRHAGAPAPAMMLVDE